MKSMLPLWRVTALSLLLGASLSYAGETPSVDGTRVYFINIKHNDQVESPFLVQVGLSEQMGIAPAAADWPDTGHHHLVINSPTPNPNKAIPKDKVHLHLSMGQSEVTLDLPPGQHTLQAVFADYAHIMHEDPIVSDTITITVK